MPTTNDEDFDIPGREFSLPSEIVKVSKAARVNMRQSTAREISIPNVAEDAPQGLDVGRYLHALRRNWLLGSVLGIICAGPLAVLAWWLNPNTYTATEYLRVSARPTPLIFDTAENSGPSGKIDVDSFKNTQRQLLLQPLALNKALKDSDTSNSPLVRDQADPIHWLREHIEVTFPDKAEIMNVSLTLTDPVVAHRIAKAIVDTYMQDVVAKGKLERIERIDRLEKVLVEAEEKVRKKRSELSNIVDALGTSDSSTLNLAQQSTLQQFGQLRGELSKINFELARVKGEVEARGGASKPGDGSSTKSKTSLEANKLETGGDSSTNSVPLDSSNHTSADGVETPSMEIMDVRLLEALETDPVASRLAIDVERLQKTISTTEKRYDPKMAASFTTKYRAKLEEVTAKLADRKKRIQQLYNFGGVPTGNPEELLSRKIGVLEKQDAQIRAEMKALEIESRRFGRSSIDVEMKRREIDGLDPLVAKVSQEIERTKIELNSGSRITQFPTSGVPTIGENKKRIPLTAAAGVFGLLLPMGILVLLDSLKNCVNNVQTINNGLKLTIIGSLPRIPNRLMRRLNDPTNAAAKMWRERVSESMSAVTAMLLRKLTSEGHRIIMISSARSGEGKSTLSEQLARSLAQSGHRTLLIDFDLRRPNLHLRFNVPLEPGVCEVLRHGADLLQTVRQTDSPNLSLLTAGNSAGSLLLESANGSLEALFNQCRTEYELVLIDSSPILPVVDARLIGQHTDGAILTIVKDTSQVPQIMSACKILEDYGIAELGCVFTGDEGDDGSYGGYGSYGRLPGEPTAALENKGSRPSNAM